MWKAQVVRPGEGVKMGMPKDKDGRNTGGRRTRKRENRESCEKKKDQEERGREGER